MVSLLTRSLTLGVLVRVSSRVVQEYLDTDNGLITFEAPTEQEIVESLAEVDPVGSSESDNQLEDWRYLVFHAIRCLDKLRTNLTNYSPAAKWFCSMENFPTFNLYSKHLKIVDSFNNI